MKVTALTAQQKDPNRINVMVDSKYRFSLDISQVVSLGVKVGREYSDAELAEIEGETHPAPFGLYQGVQLLGTISARDHSDIQSILDTGFALRVELEHPDGRDQLQITLLDPLDDRLF